MLLVALMSTAASAVTGYWTGRIEQVRTVGGKDAVKCYYSVNLVTYSVLIVWKETEQYRPECPSTYEFE